MTPIKAFVTGGAGFIASHLTDALLAQGHSVTVYDNFSTGRELFLRHNLGNKRFRLIRGDILDLKKLPQSVRGHDAVFHFAANADVRGGMTNTTVDLEQNIIGTHRVLEAVRKARVPKIVFASSATVYGEPDRFPTPETQTLLQTSIYGAAKLSAEAMIQAYAEYFGLRTWTFRFVSWIGERYTHGVVYDFVKKLQKNPKELEVLGNGRQKKSFLYVKDGVRGILTSLKASPRGSKNVFNLGHDRTMEVREIAAIVCEEMGLKNVRVRCTGGARGWLGDSPIVHLDTRRIKKLGWRAQTGIAEGIRRTVRYLLQNPQALERK